MAKLTLKIKYEKCGRMWLCYIDGQPFIYGKAETKTAAKAALIKIVTPKE